jgi:UDP-N-acetylglucosamine--N-acetylmuramyl-(pentapeptide) pyrophosphoryl-undecaprenol N-acetylglucosamine transferase
MQHERAMGSDLTNFHLVLAGGGSGGHVFPALAVAEEVRRRGGAVSFIGSLTGMEARLVPAREIPFHALAARPVVGRGPLGKAAAAATLAASSWRARLLVRQMGASAVLGTGGYVSAPTVLGARLAGVPAVLLEPNATAGAANRFLSRWARGACVAFPETAEGLRCPAWVTGAPVRRELFEVSPELPPGPPRLLVLGGSQGARQLNLLLPEALELVAPKIGKLRVVHQCGEAHLESTREEYGRRSLGGIEVEAISFLDPLAPELGKSHLVICRAGAITLAELAAAGRGSMLIPLEIAEGHQRRNAEALEAAGAARVLAGNEATAAQLAELISQLLGSRHEVERMAAAARALARPDAASAIVARLLEVAA